ncbi:hypothetical protein [Prescottella equi]
MTPETIQAIGIVITGILTIWVGRQSIELKRVRDELTEVKTAHAQDRENWERDRTVDRGIIRAAARFIRDQSNHIALLCGLLRHHAPEAEIPPEPTLPDILDKEM